MHGICAKSNPYRAERAERFLPVTSPGFPGFRRNSAVRTSLLAGSARQWIHLERLPAVNELRSISADRLPVSHSATPIQFIDCED